jgi:ethanolamine utilization cobalamin adenosyltransferase
MTHLYGNQLIEKDNPVIVFRGKLDSLCALILEAQVLGEEKNNSGFVNDLQEILEFVRSLFPAEYKRVPLGEFRVLGYGSKELREISHNPEKYFGRKHLLVHQSMGPLPLRLNRLRTTAREAELAAAALLRDTKTNPAPCKSQDAERSRKDIVEALNRLSGLFYMLMYKYLPEDFNPGLYPN